MKKAIRDRSGTTVRNPGVSRTFREGWQLWVWCVREKRAQCAVISDIFQGIFRQKRNVALIVCDYTAMCCVYMFLCVPYNVEGENRALGEGPSLC